MSNTTMTRTLTVIAAVQALAIATLAVVWLAGAPVDAATEPDASPLLRAPQDAAAAKDPPPREHPATASSAEVAAPTSTPGVAADSRPAPEGCILFGTVSDHEGKSVADCRITVLAEGDPKIAGSAMLQQLRRQYAIAGLQPGRWTMKVQSAGFLPWEESLVLSSPPQHHRRDVVLQQAWMLKVRIDDTEGKPLNDTLSTLAKERMSFFRTRLMAIATRQRPPAQLPLTHADEVRYGLGKWTGDRGFGRAENPLPKGCAGVLQLEKREPLFVSAVLRHLVLATVEVAPGQEEVVLTVSLEKVLGSLCTVRLRCIDGVTGKPMPGVRVSLNDQGSFMTGEPTDAEGRCVMKDQRPGLLSLSASTNSHEAPSVIVTVPAGGELDLGDIALMPVGQLKLAATDPEGNVVFCAVQVVPLDAAPHPAMRQREISSSASQMIPPPAELPLRLYPGRYLLRVTAADAKLSLGAMQEIDTRTLGDQTLRVTLQREPSLRFVIAADEAPVEIELVSSTGRTMWRREYFGRLSFDRSLPAGDYTAVLRTGDGRKTTRQIRLGTEGAVLTVP